MNKSADNSRRLALILSGTVDALIGGVFLLIGFGWMPVDVRNYGVEPWHAVLVGAVLFFIGIGFVAYNLSRWE